MKLSSLFLALSLVATATAHCDDGGLVDGVDPEDNNGIYKGEFDYPDTDDDNEDLFDIAFLLAIRTEDQTTFTKDGVKTEEAPNEPATFRDYQAHDEDDNLVGGTLDIAAFYGADADRFLELCEEAWACAEFKNQFAAERSDGALDYDERAFCFDRAMGVSTNQQTNQFAIRENHIVKTCWGGNSDVTKANNITELEIQRDSTCATARDYADRLAFDSNDLPGNLKDLCSLAVNCLKSQSDDILQSLKDEGLIDGDELDDALEGGDQAAIYSNTGEVTFEVCFEQNETQINATLNNCLELKEVVDGCVVPPEYNFDKQPGCGVLFDEGALPACPSDLADQFQDFGPAYPDQEAGYRGATASIRALFIPCDTDRTSADAVGVILFLKAIFDRVLIAAVQIQDALPKDFPYIPFVLLAAIPRVIVLAFDIVLQQADFHDGLVQGAEIEALYENTRQLLSGSAAIYDEVVCRCAQESLRGYGCDSVDNDCNDVVDDCSEDQWAPEITLGCAASKCSATTFKTEQEAIDCVAGQTKVVDDCDQDLPTPAFDRSGTCAESTITVSVSDKCGNPALERSVSVSIDDGEPPEVSCGFLQPGNPQGGGTCFYNTDGPCIDVHGQCYGLNGFGDCPWGTQLRQVEDEITKLKVWNPSVQGAEQLEDVNLVYNASDACGGDLDVRVEVFANELEDYHDPHEALLFEDDNENDAAELLLSATICVPNTGGDGQCVRDPMNPLIRIYTVEVTATDSAGLVAKDTCQVVIIPLWTDIDDYDLSQTTQKFHLQSYSSTFSEAR